MMMTTSRIQNDLKHHNVLALILEGLHVFVALFHTCLVDIVHPVALQLPY